jgi:hypothetical protein
MTFNMVLHDPTLIQINELRVLFRLKIGSHFNNDESANLFIDHEDTILHGVSYVPRAL